MLQGLINTVTGQIKAEEKRKNITLYGLNGNALVDEIYRIWRTTRIGNGIFTKVSKLSVSFHKFFLLDIIYTLEKILQQKYCYISRRSLLKAVAELKQLTDLRLVFNDGNTNPLIDKSKIGLFKLNPLPWQNEYLDIYSDRIQRYKLKGHLLAAAAGSGKSIGALVLMECLKIDTLFVISPKNAVIDVWQETLDNKYKVQQKYWHSLMNTPPKSGLNKYILHYEYLPKFLEYMRTVNRSSLGKVGIILDECVHPDTEVLTPKGFKKISQITTDDLVLQYNQDGTNEWVKPSRVVKKPTAEVHHYRTYRWEQIVTPNHRMIYSENNQIKESLSKDFDVNRSQQKIITSGNLRSGMNNELTMRERLLIAIQADSNIIRYSVREDAIRVEVKLSKIRKIKRLNELLYQCGIEHVSKKDRNSTRFFFKIPISAWNLNETLRTNPKALKLFSAWVNLEDKNSEWCKAFIDEVCCWDGYEYNGYNIKYYSCREKDNVDIVQLIASNAGYGTNLSMQSDNRKETYSDIYRLHIRQTNLVSSSRSVMSISNHRENKKIIQHLDTPMDFYCVTVPSGMFYTRFNNKVSVTGNCHNFNDIRSNRVQSLIELTNNYHVDHSLWMSGTPLKAMGKEVIPLLTCIDPIFDKECEERFVGVFGRATDRALDILANRIGIISHKVEKGAVMDDLKMHRYRADVELPNGNEYTISTIRDKMKKFVEQRTAYYKQNMKMYEQQYKDGVAFYKEKFRNNPAKMQQLSTYQTYVAIIKRGYDPAIHKEESVYCNKFEKNEILPILPPELKEGFRKSKSVYKYVNLTILGECLGVVLGKARTQCNIDIATHLNSLKLNPISDDAPELGVMSIKELINNAEKKTIMFSSFVDVVKSVAGDLSTQGFRPLMVYGETNKDLPQIVSKFDKDDTANPLVATFQSLSTAVPLVMANVVVMLNSPYRDHEYKQAVARAYRKSQDRDVYVIDVFLKTGDEDNISTRSKDIADEAAGIVAKMMGYEKVDLSATAENYTEEGCLGCNVSAQFDNLYQTGLINQSSGPKTWSLDKTSQDNDLKNNKTTDIPYYKTDIGMTFRQIAEATEDDPVWDEESARIVLRDYANNEGKDKTKLAVNKYKNSSATW